MAERVRSGEFIGITAEHYERAGDSAHALEYFDRASSDAANRYGIDASDVYNERALRQQCTEQGVEL